MSDDEKTLRRLDDLEAKLDRVLALLESKKTSKARPKTKPAPLTEAEIPDLQKQFGTLFERWMGGQEIEVEGELEKLDVEQLRRFADANNLNVTSKMPRTRVLQLIGARFREKRQLHRPPSPRASSE